MAAHRGDEATAVGELDEGLKWAHALGFFRFVALAERLTAGAARVGADGPFNEEAIRFRHDPTLTFSAGDIAAVEMKFGERTRFDVVTTFLGLTGSSTPLPLYFTEEVLHEDDGMQGAFLDLFHHRLLSLLYRATVKYQVAAEASSEGADLWVKRLLNLVGLDLDTTKSPLPLGVTLSLLPALAASRRSPATLEAALAHVLLVEAPGATVQVEPFVGEWSPLDARDVCRLGVKSTTLGVDQVLGSRSFDCSARFRISIGPVDQATFRRLSEGGDLRATVDATVALFVNDWLAYDLAVTVDRSRASLRLSAANEAARLGVDSWLGAYDADKAAVRISTSRKATATR